MFGLVILTPSLQAVQNFTENVVIGTTQSNKTLTVHGTSNFKGNVAVTGNTTVNQDSGTGC